MSSSRGQARLLEGPCQRSVYAVQQHVRQAEVAARHGVRRSDAQRRRQQPGPHIADEVRDVH